MTAEENEGRVELVGYSDELKSAFERLNREWIEACFEVEEADRAVFADPMGKIVGPGGQVFFVIEDGEAKGTCAVLRRDEKTYELAKMAVAASDRGKGFGDMLLRAAIEFAKNSGADSIVLSSNTKLKPAIRLYEKYGFKTVPIVADERYHRVDIMMRLELVK